MIHRFIIEEIMLLEFSFAQLFVPATTSVASTYRNHPARRSFL
jgi:hypothetical protein